MHDFCVAMVQPPVARCIGVELRPFRLGHYVILNAMRSSFVGGSPMPPAYDDLIASAFVCSNSWAENQRLLKSKFRRWVQLKTWGLLAGKFDIVTQSAILLDYVQSSTELPSLKNTRGGRQIWSTWETRLLKFLLSIGFTVESAMDLPLVQAHALFIAQQEEDGVEYKSRKDLEIEDRMARAADEMADLPEFKN